jgi:hypothetical protein
VLAGAPPFEELEPPFDANAPAAPPLGSLGRDVSLLLVEHAKATQTKLMAAAPRKRTFMESSLTGDGVEERKR